MRAITRKVTTAFHNARAFKSGNDQVLVSGDNVTLLLHGNAIARNGPDNGLEVNLCGWNTKTTRDRLNSLAGVSIHTVKGVPYLNGVEMPVKGWAKVQGVLA